MGPTAERWVGVWDGEHDRDGRPLICARCGSSVRSWHTRTGWVSAMRHRHDCPTASPLRWAAELRLYGPR